MHDRWEVVQWHDERVQRGFDFGEQDEETYANFLQLLDCDCDLEVSQRCLAFLPMFEGEALTTCEKRHRVAFDKVFAALILEPKTVEELRDALRISCTVVRYIVERLKNRQMLIQAPKSGLLFVKVSTK